MAREKRDPDAPEYFPEYDEYYSGVEWPSLTDDGDVKLTHVFDMAPQYAASSIAKMKRWVFRQWADEMGGERNWVQVKQTTLYRVLSSKATGDEDFSLAFEADHGLDLHRATILAVTSMFEGARTEDFADVDCLDGQNALLLKLGSRVMTNLYRKGYNLSLKK